MGQDSYQDINIHPVTYLSYWVMREQRYVVWQCTSYIPKTLQFIRDYWFCETMPLEKVTQYFGLINIIKKFLYETISLVKIHIGGQTHTTYYSHWSMRQPRYVVVWLCKMFSGGKKLIKFLAFATIGNIQHKIARSMWIMIHKTKPTTTHSYLNTHSRTH